ncbi:MULTISPECIES: DUF3613 domain-containing protein [unclassified Pseudomonas]|uniref:DUF3613 domain-containing protein n=1 Tax=unclassified Pseudomonas TaxID=196821 RepID=UPI0035C23553
MIRYILLAMLLPLTVQAEEPARRPPSETATEALLRVQSSGTQASVQPQVQTARERDQSMQRWLDSYKHPIPEVFSWSKMKSSGE